MKSLKKQSQVELADEYGLLTKQYRKLKSRRKKLREELIRRGNERYKGQKYTIECTLVERCRFDQTKFEQNHPKLYVKYTTVDEMVRITVADKQRSN